MSAIAWQTFFHINLKALPQTNVENKTKRRRKKMGDSDDDYESSMNKRRGQSRNKFRSEREDSMKSNGNNSFTGFSDPKSDMKRKDRDFGNNGSSAMYNSKQANRRSNFEPDYDEEFRGPYGARPHSSGARFF